MLDPNIPSDLLDLKSRLDSWRLNRRYLRQPIPLKLRLAAQEMARRYSPSLVRRLLKLDPWRLNKSKKSAPTSHQPPPTAFFPLPLPAPASSLPLACANCRLQIDRPDGSRLTFFLSNFDLSSIPTLWTQFLRA